MIRVRASNHGGIVEEQTKTEAGERVVPLFPSARKVLAARELRSPFTRPEGFVFTTSIGTPLDPNTFVKRDFRKALETTLSAGQAVCGHPGQPHLPPGLRRWRLGAHPRH